MVRTKLTAKRIPHLPSWLRSQCQQRKIKRPYKIKIILPEQKQVEIKKMATWSRQSM